MDREPHDAWIVARPFGRLDHVGRLGNLLRVDRGQQKDRAHALESGPQRLRLEEVADEGLHAPIL